MLSLVEITEFRLESKSCKGFFLNRFSTSESTRIYNRSCDLKSGLYLQIPNENHLQHQTSLSFRSQIWTTNDWNRDFHKGIFLGITAIWLTTWVLHAQVSYFWHWQEDFTRLRSISIPLIEAKRNNKTERSFSSIG